MEKNILITSVGNIGIGNQILNSLRLSKEKLTIVGTDISENVEFEKLDKYYKVTKPNQKEYFDSMKKIISENNIGIIFVGSLSEALWFFDNMDYFEKKKITVVLGEKQLFSLCADKNELFTYLKNSGIILPKFKKINNLKDCYDIDFFPVVLKQNKNAVASNHVYIAFDKEDLYLLSNYLLKNNVDLIAQEWIGDKDNEFSVSVTSDAYATPVGVVAMRRDFGSAISFKNKINHAGKDFYISSGITQGSVENISELHTQAKNIAVALNSKGPLNLQGKWEKGIFYLIDAHPAITSSVYMKALAGYNEPLYYVKTFLDNESYILDAKEMCIFKKIVAEIKGDRDVY